MFGINDFSKPIIDYSNFDINMLGDALLFGGSILLIGMVTIFCVLSVLWLCLIVFKIVFHDIPEKKATKKGVELAPVYNEELHTDTRNNDTEIVAVIAAAIAMAESEHSDTKFRVVSFKRI